MLRWLTSKNMTIIKVYNLRLGMIPDYDSEKKIMDPYVLLWTHSQQKVFSVLMSHSTMGLF